MFVAGQPGHIDEHNVIAAVVVAAERYDSIQEALDTVSLAGGGTVMLGTGTHDIASQLSIPAGCRLQGSSSVGCIVRANAVMDIAVDLASNAVLADVYLNANSNARTGVLVDGARPHLHRIRVQGADYGIVVDGAQNARLFDCFVQDCGRCYSFVNGAANSFVYGCDASLATPGVGADGRTIWLGNDLTGTYGWSTAAAQLFGNRQIRFFGGIFERGTSDYQVQIEDGPACLFVGSEINAALTASVIVADGDVTFRDCRFSLEAGTASIASTDGEVRVRDCTYTGSGGQTEVQMHVESGGTVDIS